MSLLSSFAVFVAAYAAAGRTGTVAACLLAGFGLWETLGITLLIDAAQIPLYGAVLQAAVFRIKPTGRFQAWIRHKCEKAQARVEGSRFWMAVFRLKYFSIFAVSTIPFRGGGVLSACFFSLMFGISKAAGTALILAGSCAGTCLTFGALVLPVRWLYAL